jgi:hypothetical protein
MFRAIPTTALAFCLLSLSLAAHAQDRPTLEILWPKPDSVIELGNDTERTIGVVVKVNYALLPAGQCGDNHECGHMHMKIDPNGDTCNIPGKPYNSMNSDFGGDLIKARFGHCPDAVGKHVIGVLLADDHHKPILVDGKAVTALVTVTTK